MHGQMQAEPIIATTSTLPPIKPATNEQVRSKFLSMIGIESKLPPAEDGSLANAAKGAGAPYSKQPYTKAGVPGRWVHPRSQQVNVFTETLKYDRAADERYAPKRRKTEKGPSSKPKKRLNFDETVKVVPIPMRTEYSNRVRTRLWSSALEIHTNAARNTVEFAAEG